MTLMAAVWLVIVCALILANLPFILQQPLIVWPWCLPQQRRGAAAPDRDHPATPISLVARAFWCLAQLAALGLWAWATLVFLGGAFAGGGLGSALGLLTGLALLAAILLLPGHWLARQLPPGAAYPRPFLDRLLDVLLLYALTGALGYALELNQGNAFSQGWEFYAVTLALFLVMAYPGFVWRYMMKRRKH